MATRIVAFTSDMAGNQVLLRNSEGDEVVSSHPKDLLHFIGENYSDTSMNYRELKVAWNLDVFISLVLRYMGLPVCKELTKPAHEALFSFTDSGAVTLHDINHKPDVLPAGMYDVFYVPSKVFGLQVGSHKSYIYHLEQYYDDDPPETDPMVIHAKTQDLCDAFRQMGMNPFKLTSPIAIYESSVLNHLDVPTILDLPKDMGERDATEIIEWSQLITPRDWIEAFQVGRWNIGESWDYDLSSAYGYHLSQLYNFRYAKFWKSSTMCPDAHWGLLRGRVNIHDNVTISPLVCDIDGNMMAPIGSQDDVRTLNEVRFIEKWGIGEFQLQEGWFWKYTAPQKPFEVPLRRVFDLRSKNGLVKKLAKRVGASVWAKLIQNNMDGAVNKHFNPIMAMQVCTNTRLHVADFIYRNQLQDHVLHVGIDGVRVDTEVRIDGKTGMGNWKLADPSAVIVLSPGRVFTSDKKPQGLYYDDIVAMIKQHPRESYYSKTLRRRQTLRESVEAGDISQLGKVKDFHSAIDINLARTSQSRDFPSFPHTGNDLLTKRYTSKPRRV